LLKKQFYANKYISNFKNRRAFSGGQGGKMKRVGILAAVILLASCTSMMPSVSFPHSTANTSYDKALEHFGLVTSRSLVFPAVCIGSGYTLAPKLAVWDSENQVFLRPTFTCLDQKDPDPKLVADYEGIVMYKTSIKTPFTQTKFSQPRKNGQEVYFVAIGLEFNGSSWEVKVPAISAKVSQITKNLFLIDQAFKGLFVGTGIFDSKGGLLGIASSNMYSWVISGVQIPSFGVAISSKVFEHFQLIIQQKRNKYE